MQQQCVSAGRQPLSLAVPQNTLVGPGVIAIKLFSFVADIANRKATVFFLPLTFLTGTIFASKPGDYASEASFG